VKDHRDCNEITRWDKEEDLGYKGLCTKSDHVKGESIKGVKDPGARIQEGQDRGLQRM
jgi:hypothetical protein